MRFVTALLFLGAAISAPGCNDSDREATPPSETPESPQALLEACTGDRSSDLFATFAGLEDLLLAAQDPATAPGLGVALVPSPDPADPRFAFTYRVPIDLDADGQRDDAIDGKVTFAKDPMLGLAAGDMAGVSWTLQGDDAQGSGTLALRFASAETVEITGSGTITRGGCTMDFDILGLVMSMTGGPGGRAVLAQGPDAPLLTGNIRFVVATGAGTLGGTMGIGTFGVEVRDVDVNGASAGDFALDLG